jgi:DNA-binding transcriptional MerR regulator
MSWSIAQVARMSGITARTLRHYDAIGLLSPSWVTDSGRRFYDHDQLLRLQQILLLRDLGLGLHAVADALRTDSPDDVVAALHHHLRRLQAERDRYDTLLRTVRTTIDSIQKGVPMNGEAMFTGFEHDPYEAEARQQFGDEAVDAANERVRNWTPDQAEQARNGYASVHRRLAELRAQGVDVHDRRVQEVVAEHYRVVCLFWTPNADAYRGLGRMYTDDERFRQNIGLGDDALVEYLRDAMNVYADTLSA